MWKLAQVASVLLLTGVVTASSGVDILDDIQRSFQGGVGAILMPRQTKNLQTFSGALGGIKADPVSF